LLCETGKREKKRKSEKKKPEKRNTGINDVYIA